MGTLATTETRTIDKIPVTRIYGGSCCRMIINKKTGEIETLMMNESGITEIMIDGTDRELILSTDDKEVATTVKDRALVFPERLKAEAVCVAIEKAVAESIAMEEEKMKDEK
jgi:hypothetical protein